MSCGLTDRYYLVKLHSNKDLNIFVERAVPVARRVLSKRSLNYKTKINTTANIDGYQIKQNTGRNYTLGMRGYIGGQGVRTPS